MTEEYKSLIGLAKEWVQLCMNAGPSAEAVKASACLRNLEEAELLLIEKKLLLQAEVRAQV